MIEEANIKEYWKELISGKKNKTVNQAILLLLRILSWLYYVVFELKRLAVLTRNLKAKVISIGNITLGGTGKTPMVIELALMFQNKGKKVAVLSRGYKSLYEHQIAVVSDGQNIFLEPKQAGDEPYLLAKRLSGIPVIIGKDRLRTGRYAINKFDAEIIILDDGFQYWRLKRDLDIVLVDALQPPETEKLFPRGLLREAWSSLKRAHILIITNATEKERLALLTKRLESINPQALILTSRYKPLYLFDQHEQKDYPLEEIKGKKILALSSIGNPESFETILRNLETGDIVSLRFPDHHQYTYNDINRIKSLSNDVDLIVTTEKDMVRLEELLKLKLKIFVLQVALDIDVTKIFKKYLKI